MWGSVESPVLVYNINYMYLSHSDHGQLITLRLGVCTADAENADFNNKMQKTNIILLLVPILLVIIKESGGEKEKKLQIGIKKRVDPEKCKIKSRKGDILHMHYTGKLEDGTEFDSSLSRKEPFVFTLGTGQVIKGWDQGLLNMCEEEKRKLVIPSDMGYGERGAPPKIPGGATLVFEVELIKIERKEEL